MMLTPKSNTKKILWQTLLAMTIVTIAFLVYLVLIGIPQTQQRVNELKQAGLENPVQD